MIERFQRNLLTLDGTGHRLSLRVQKVIDVMLRNQDALDDPRIRTISLTRATAAGDWVVTSCLAFLDAEGREQPLFDFPERRRNPKARD